MNVNLRSIFDVAHMLRSHSFFFFLFFWQTKYCVVRFWSCSIQLSFFRHIYLDDSYLSVYNSTLEKFIVDVQFVNVVKRKTVSRILKRNGKIGIFQWYRESYSMNSWWYSLNFNWQVYEIIQWMEKNLPVILNVYWIEAVEKDCSIYFFVLAFFFLQRTEEVTKTESRSIYCRLWL